MSTPTTEGLAPKAVAATLAALIAPPLADLIGVDAVWLGGLITAAFVAAAAYFAPPAGLTGRELDEHEPDEDQVPTYLMGRDDDPTPVQDQGDGDAQIEQANA